MISVTGYDPSGVARVFGRHESDELIAKARSEHFAVRWCLQESLPVDLTGWTFRKDVCDRQLFQPARPR